MLFNKTWENKLIADVSKKYRIEDRSKFIEWAKREKIKGVSQAKSHWTNLSPRVQSIIDFSSPPRFIDHSLMFNRFDGTRLYITQPYLTIEYINTDESFQKFLEDNELISKVSELDSWYMPGSTILIQFEIRNELEYIKKMKMQRKNIRPFL